MRGHTDLKSLSRFHYPSYRLATGWTNQLDHLKKNENMRQMGKYTVNTQCAPKVQPHPAMATPP